MNRIGLIVAAASALWSSAALAAYEFFVTVDGVAQATATGPIYLKVESSRDLNGGGARDKAVIRLACARGQLRAAAIRYDGESSRDSAGGQASGRKAAVRDLDWEPASRKLASEKLYIWWNGTSTPNPGRWAPVRVTSPQDICPLLGRA